VSLDCFKAKGIDEVMQHVNRHLPHEEDECSKFNCEITSVPEHVAVSESNFSGSVVQSPFKSNWIEV
jgi:hypothetical protein